MAACQRCASSIPDNAVYCPRCGHRVDAGTSGWMSYPPALTAGPPPQPAPPPAAPPLQMYAPMPAQAAYYPQRRKSGTWGCLAVVGIIAVILIMLVCVGVLANAHV